MKKKIKIKYLYESPFYEWYSSFFNKILSKHYELEISEQPDYIISDAHREKHLNYNCIRIAFAAENVRPDFNSFDYAIGFDHLFFEDRYIRYPLYLLYEGSLNKALKKHLSIDTTILDKKKGFCNFVVSNAKDDDIRVKFFHLLSQYKKVDSGGKYRNNVGGPITNKFLFQENYKFSICFENSSTPGYLTEKLIQAAAAKTIPIYWGDPKATYPLRNGGGGINSRAIINVHEFENFEKIVEHIKLIDQDDELFIKILKEPLFSDDNHEMIFNNELEQFLITIINQENKKAFRRGFGQARLAIEERFIKVNKYKKTKFLIKELLSRFLKKLNWKIKINR
jgi:hypothetical protein